VCCAGSGSTEAMSLLDDSYCTDMEVELGLNVVMLYFTLVVLLLKQ